MTTLTTIEKAAKLMGYEVVQVNQDSVAIKMNSNQRQYAKAMSIAGLHSGNNYTVSFNPYTSQSDLSDVIDELEISFRFGVKVVTAYPRCENIFCDVRKDDHPNKFAARAHAVMAVVEQIYDAKFGKDGE